MLVELSWGSPSYSICLIGAYNFLGSLKLMLRLAQLMRQIVNLTAHCFELSFFFSGESLWISALRLFNIARQLDNLSTAMPSL